MAKLHVEIDEKKLAALVVDYLSDILGQPIVGLEDVVIEVKSKQNYRAEWEKAEFRARVDKLL